jgi:glycosyltransferase involved in cell wall biosynthesis/peptidoglycan/xylan/chitin deacetylase (PgdA/CDA1 family)
MLRPIFKLLSHGKLTVLLFHKVPIVRSAYVANEIDLATFERVVTNASRLFNIIPLDDAVLALRAGNLPDRAACITFDDGYADWLGGAVPVLERHQLHATFFITTGQFSGQPMWNERILHAIAQAPASLGSLVLPGLPLPHMALQSVADKQWAIRQLDELLKYQEPQLREHTLLALEQITGASARNVPVMSDSDLRTIHSKGFGIGSHTVSHPILTQCNAAMALQEMVQSREQLEAIVRGKITAFAYPNGVPQRDFDPTHIEMVKRAGYTCALTTHFGAANGATSVFQIPRFTPWGPTAGKMTLQFARNLLGQPKTLVEQQTDQKRVLMVAFHFPPQAGSSGILRTLNFVKYLPQNGWTPTVLTASAHAYVEQRNDLVGAIPPRTHILRAFALDAAKHLSIANKYPMLLALPDRWSSWWVRAVVLGMRDIRKHRPHLIWSTYPISTAHLIGGTLARLSGLPWVADFRDPMVNADYPSHPLQRKLWQWLEAYVLRHATACVFTTLRAAIAYGERYPASAAKCMVIENGYDEDAFTGVQPNRFGTPPSTLLMLHSGLIYPHDRNPSTFFAAIQALIDEGTLDRSRLCIRFRAPHHDEEVKTFAKAHGLEDVVDIAPPVPYRQAIAEMMGADLLLVFQGSYFNAQIPAKIYEYVRAQRPVLAVLDPAGDTAKQLGQFEGVYFGDISDPKKIKMALSKLIVEYKTTLKNSLIDNLSNIKKYSRIAQSERLGSIFSDISLKQTYLFVLPWPLTGLGGVNQVVINLAREMQKSSQLSTLVLVADWNAATPVWEVVHGIKTVRWRIRSFNENMGIKEKIAYRLWLGKFSADFERFCRAHSVVAINPHFPDATTFALKSSVDTFKKLTPFIVSFHGGDLSRIQTGTGSRLAQWQKLVTGASAVVTCSHDLGQKLTQTFGGHVALHVVHNGLDADAFVAMSNLDKPRTGRMILNVAKFEHKKGQDVLIQAFARISGEYPDVNLVLVGATDIALPDLRTMCARNDLIDRVTFCPDMPHSHVATVFNNASIFTFPSRQEPFGIVLLEAGAFGLPVVATRVGGIPEILTDGVTGKLVSPDNPEELATCLRALLDAPVDAKAMGERLRKHVTTHFTWSIAYEKYLALVPLNVGAVKSGSLA